jgi:hypothetical protein
LHLRIGWRGSKRMKKQLHDETLARLVRLANTPGWKDYAWGLAKELDADPYDTFKGIKQDLVKIMLAQKANAAENSSKVE